MSHNSLPRMLMFVHIPKAAGTTLYKVIENQYSKQAVYLIDDAIEEDTKRFILMPEQARSDRYRCVVGHLPYGLHEFVPNPMDYITVLREPVDRLISHYYYVKSTPTNQFHNWVASENVTLERYILEGQQPNRQTRMVCGFTKDDPERMMKPETDILAIAKANLESRFAAFGLSERFDETILFFQKALRWRNPHYVAVNITEKRPSRDETKAQITKLIERHSPLDFELYEYAKRLFDERLAENGIDESRLEAYRRANRRYQLFYQSQRSVRKTVKKILRLR